MVAAAEFRTPPAVSRGTIEPLLPATDNFVLSTENVANDSMAASMTQKT